jgi:thioesterase domain-containing protein
VSDATNDIVTSLKASVEWIRGYEHESWFGTADLQAEAASVIEQLEAERVDLAAELDACNQAHDRNDDLIADLRQQLERARSNLDGERALADRLAMLLVNSQACDAPLWWVMERVDLLDEWHQRRQ